MGGYGEESGEKCLSSSPNIFSGKFRNMSMTFKFVDDDALRAIKNVVLADD